MKSLKSNMQTKFSIITAVYNGAQYISKCIESIVNNGYDLKNVEHIIIDDGSIDDTKKICEEYAKKYPHIIFTSKPNGNWGSVINYVKHNKLIHGDYTSICDADDFLLPGALAKIDKSCIMKNGKRADFFQTAFTRWNGKHLRIKILPYFFCFTRSLIKYRKLQYYNPLIVPQSVYMNSEIFNSLPDLKEGVSYQDTILFTTAYLKAKTIKFTTKSCAVYWYQRPGNSMSQNKIERGIKLWMENLQIFADNNLIESYLYYLAGKKDLRKYFKKNNIKYTFKKRKYDFSGFPWYIRWAFKIMFGSLARKYIVWKK